MKLVKYIIVRTQCCLAVKAKPDKLHLHYLPVIQLPVALHL